MNSKGEIMQHLKIEVLHLGANHPWGECLVKIVEQNGSLRGGEDLGEYNGIIISSCHSPEIRESSSHFYIQGTHRGEDNMILPCSLEFLARLREAIAEFNSKGKETRKEFPPGSVEVIE